MGFFDFLKRKELEKIKYLENRVKDLENQNNYLSKSLAKYSPIIDLDSEVQKIQESISKIEKDKISVLNQYEQLKNQYQTALITYEELKKKISIHPSIFHKINILYGPQKNTIYIFII